MKKKILELIAQGKTPTEIKKELGCSRSTVYLHTIKGEQEKANKRRQKWIENNPEKEKQRQIIYKERRHLLTKAIRFQKNNQSNRFTFKDILEKFGQVTKCYLTGQKIDLLTDKFEFDHIIPISRGGNSDINNLGITIPKANRVKHTLLVNELLDLCKIILKNFNNENVV